MKHALAAAAVLALCAVAPARAQAPAAPSPLLMTQDLIGQPGKEVRMLTIVSPPGAASAAHRHNGQVFVYMLEGSMIMQVQGQPPVTLLPGQTFYESPGDIHVVSKNASATQPAKFLAVMIMDKGAPTVVPVK
jgi:quercetin dioxygenase-like cupin family protein